MILRENEINTGYGEMVEWWNGGMVERFSWPVDEFLLVY